MTAYPPKFDQDHQRIWDIIMAEPPHTPVMEIGFHQGEFADGIVARFDEFIMIDGNQDQVQLMKSRYPQHRDRFHQAVVWRDSGYYAWWEASDREGMQQGASSVILPELPLESWSSRQVRTFAIDDWWFPAGLIKMDCSGADTAVVMGADRTIRETRPIIILEWAGGRRAEMMGVTDQEWHDFWQRHRYDIQFVDGTPWHPDHWHQPTDSYNLVCRPL